MINNVRIQLYSNGLRPKPITQQPYLSKNQYQSDIERLPRGQKNKKKIAVDYIHDKIWQNDAD